MTNFLASRQRCFLSVQNVHGFSYAGLGLVPIRFHIGKEVVFLLFCPMSEDRGHDGGIVLRDNDLIHALGYGLLFSFSRSEIKR